MAQPSQSRHRSTRRTSSSPSSSSCPRGARGPVALVAALGAVLAGAAELSARAEDAPQAGETSIQRAPAEGAPGAGATSTQAGALSDALAEGAPARVFWQEHFDRRPIDWVDPFDHGAAKIARIYSVQQEGALSFLHARHDYTGSDRPPSIDYGRAFQTNAPPLEKVRALRWKWRVRRHPAVTDDPWLDIAASLYVVIKVPGVLTRGKGFKLAWLAKPGPSGTHQHGLLQIALRSEPPTNEFRSESVDLCALFRKEYGACEGEHVQYIGVMTDADGTKTVAEADYADFELVTAP